MNNFLGRIFSRKQAATVPSMDGVLRPNEALDNAAVITTTDAPDNLVSVRSEMIYSCGHNLFSMAEFKSGATPDARHHFDSDVTALAASSEGALAVGLQGVGVRIIGGRHDGLLLSTLGGQSADCITAIAFKEEDDLFVCMGSSRNSAQSWQRDLMEKQPSGSVWQVDLGNEEAICMGSNLAFPNGILLQGNSLIVSESWKHRLLRFDINSKNSSPSIVLADLPGYPGRLAPAINGGAWLSVFAPRSQLIEFVLREDAYRNRMLREISSEHWIAPTYRSGVSYSEPMQGGAVKVHGIHKAWAPTRSYGLLILLDSNMVPVRSYHSRADGMRHGVVSACELDSQVYFASKGNHVICSMPTPQSVTGSES